MRSNRKESFRYTLSEPLPALFQIIVAGKEESSKGEAKIINISPSGLMLNSPLNIPRAAMGKLSMLIFFKLNEEELTYYGSIVWKKDKGTTYDYGIELRMGERDKQELIKQLKIFARKGKSNDPMSVNHPSQ